MAPCLLPCCPVTQYPLSTSSSTMQPDYITMLKPQKVLRSFESEGSFVLRKDRGWVWLQKICFKILRWIGAYELIKTETVTYTNLRSDKLKDKIVEGIRSQGGYREGMVLTIGAAQWMELTDNRELMYEAFSYDVTAFRDSRYPGRILGVKVEVIPWIDGWYLHDGNQ